ncbi:glycosyltransferase 25 family member [Sitodiplosis mosellana]|uniref:glycosyltransferase 25 family member n=1 Tax=Sitodiplosis mosellana TaxID=263140 RepID=UPI0024448D17|nr:glycosyltransferase 25 family member [Sitodiplosis mosellana]
MNYFFVILLVCHVSLSFGSATNVTPEHGEPIVIENTKQSNEVPSTTDVDQKKPPTILIATLFRNKAHIMPLFFTYLNRIEYPKDRITLWIRSDHNEDETMEVLNQWLYKWSNAYHHVDIEYDNTTKLRDSEISQTHWSNERYLDVIRMKEEALNYGRKIWADYVFFFDADVLLTRPTTLLELIHLDVPIVAPMLLSDGLYSNFWGGMTPEYYYQRTTEYKTIYNYDQRGQFDVPMVHSAVLINLNDKRSDTLTFNKTKLGARFLLSDHDLALIPTDDIIIFALSANYSQMPLKISNEFLYGFVTVPLDAEDYIEKDYQQLLNLKIMILNDETNSLIDVEPEFERFSKYPEADMMSFDRIFMINLLRRPERRVKMERSFKEIGLDVEHVVAADGQILTQEYLEEIGVKYLPGYADPFQNRPMTKGEIGCFLSHYRVWEQQVARELNEVLVLEDDIRFEPYFKQRALHLMDEARQIGGWDLIYFGRKRLVKKNENWVEGSDHLVHASYSYWTLGYALSLEGAKKLLAAKPLENLLPVDEFLPIMFNQHQNETWKRAFPIRNLNAWSASPLLLFPTHYTGDEGYLSDTEQSDIIDIAGENGVEKKGNKENNNGSAMMKSSGDGDNHANAATANNTSIDTSFLINKVNDHATIQHQSSDQHSEL